MAKLLERRAKMPMRLDIDQEDARQIFHIVIGFIAIALTIYLGRGFMLTTIFFILIFGMFAINLRMRGVRIPIVEWFEQRFERRDAYFPGWGSACYAAGALLEFAFITDVPRIIAALFVLGVSDGISTLVGRRGRFTLPHNKSKTVEGSLAFFITSLATYLLIGDLAFILATVATIVESLPKLEDNITIPITCTVLLRII